MEKMIELFHLYVHYKKLLPKRILILQKPPDEMI